MRPTFATPDEIDVPAVTAEEMREVGRVAIEETGPTLYQMMENATDLFCDEYLIRLFIS